MAGDWIKMEKATVRKPEVRTIARLLGISRREAIGLLFEFWCWLDDCVVDGRVDACVDADVDAEFGAGFAAALKLVGWAAFTPAPDGLTGYMTIPNSGRHFGETSKKRALTNERQARWRAKHVDAPVDAHVDAPPSTTPSTREEKRREDKAIGRVSRATRLPADWFPSDELRAKALQHLSPSAVALETTKFKNYWAGVGGAKGAKLDWGATFDNWILNAVKYGAEPCASNEPRKVAL